MVSRAALGQQATLLTPRLRLEQLNVAQLEDVSLALQDPESSRLTGTHQTFTREQIRTWLTSLPGQDDRADWAIIRQADGVFLGEVVLNDLDAENQSMNFRIALGQAGFRNRGYGSEATRAVVDYGLDVVGLHRISLGVYAFNPRAQRVYEKCGFVVEGLERDALRWDGRWVDLVRMSVLASDARSSNL